MRASGYIMTIAAAAAVSYGCQQLEEMRTYAPEDVLPPVLNPLDIDGIAVTGDNLDETVTFVWDAADFGVRAQVNYAIDAEYDGQDGQTRRVNIQSGITDTFLEMTYEEVNYITGLEADLGGLGVPLETPSRVRFYVGASVGNSKDVYWSAPRELELTVIYAEPRYPNVWVIGKYSNWDHARSQYLFSFGNNNEYNGIIDFGVNAVDNNGGSADDVGFKITGAATWNNATGNWGAGADRAEAEDGEIQLVNNGGNIANVYSKRYYSFAFNSTTLVLTREYAFDKLVVYGSAIGSQEQTMNFNTIDQKFWLDAVLTDGELSFALADGAERTVLGSTTAGILDDSGTPVAATGGSWRIYVNLNNPDERTYELNAEDYGKEVEEEEEITDPTGHTWGITGSAINDWGNEIDPETEEAVPDLPMVLDGDYYVRRNVHLGAYDPDSQSGEQFKIRFDNSWNDSETNQNLSFGGAADPTGITPGDGIQLTRGGGNLYVTEEGDYDIYFNEDKGFIHIRQAGEDAPGDVSWGITGSFTGWAAGNDRVLTKAESADAEYYIIEDLELTTGDSFKFREGNAWQNDYGNQLGGASDEGIAAGTAVNLVRSSASEDMSVAEDGVYDVVLYPDQSMAYFIKSDTDFDIPQKVSWGITGDVTAWLENKDLLMDEEDGYFVFKGLELAEGSELRLRYGNNDRNRSFGFQTTTDVQASSDAHLMTAAGQGRIRIAAAGEYDIYLYEEYGILYIREAGSDAPDAFSFGIQANMTEGMPDLTMIRNGDYFVCKNVWFPQGAENWMKIRVSSNDGITWGGEYIDYDTPVEAVLGGGPVVLKDGRFGAYDVWFSFNNEMIYIMTPGKHPSQAEGSEAADWGIVGAFNGWGDSGTDLKMTLEGDRYVYRGLTFAAGNDPATNSNAIKIRLGGSWDAGGNMGAEGQDVEATPGEPVQLINDGGSKNIIIPQGTFDIYFDDGQNTLWVMPSGQTPAGN